MNAAFLWICDGAVWFDGTEWLVGIVECNVTFVEYDSGSPSVAKQ